MTQACISFNYIQIYVLGMTIIALSEIVIGDHRSANTSNQFKACNVIQVSQPC